MRRVVEGWGSIWILVLVLSACGGAASSESDATQPAQASVPASPSANAVQVENTRRVLSQHVRAYARQLEEGVPRTLRLMDSPFDVSPADDAEALVRLGEELSDWIDEEREWLGDAETGECVAEAMELYDTALGQLATVVERLFDAPQDAGAATVRAEEANEDAEDALAAVEDALPTDCNP